MGYGEGTNSVMNLKSNPIVLLPSCFMLLPKASLGVLQPHSAGFNEHTYTESAAKIQVSREGRERERELESDVPH